MTKSILVSKVGINLVVYYMPTVLVSTVKLAPRVAQIIAGLYVLTSTSLSQCPPNPASYLPPY
jgi:hypothetical protein